MSPPSRPPHGPPRRSPRDDLSPQAQMLLRAARLPRARTAGERARTGVRVLGLGIGSAAVLAFKGLALALAMAGAAAVARHVHRARTAAPAQVEPGAPQRPPHARAARPAAANGPPAASPDAALAVLAAPDASVGAPARRPSDAALLSHAQRLLRDDPAAALAIVTRHAGRFARGELAPEAGVIAVEALARTGRAGECARRARAFLAAYPDGIHAARVREFLERGCGSAPEVSP